MLKTGLRRGVKKGDIAVVCSQLLGLSDLSCLENCYLRRSPQENPKMEGNSEQNLELYDLLFSVLYRPVYCTAVQSSFINECWVICVSTLVR